MEPRDLDGRQDPGHDQRRRHEVLGVVRAQGGAALAGDDDGRGDDARQHGEGMLEAEEEGEEDGHLVVEAEEGGGLFGSRHEWEVGREEEGIVVVADQTLSVFFLFFLHQRNL